MKKIFIILFICLFQNVFAGESDILNEVNTYRVKHGLSQLKMNKIISDEAKTHSREMAEHDIPFGHYGINKRVHRLFAQFKHSRGVAENVAYSYNNTDGIVKQWLGSSGHRKNIEGIYNLTGIGIAEDKSGRVYVTQIFLRT